MPEPRVVGLDLSLARTGWAKLAAQYMTSVGVLAPHAALRGYERMRFLRGEARSLCQGADLVVVEGPSYGSAAGQKGHHERAGLWWLVTYDLWAAGVPVAVAAPAAVKKYATGRGNAPKDAVLTSVVRRYRNAEVTDNNEADALVLAAMGADHLGFPLTDVPGGHRAALAAVAWPDLMMESA